MKTRLLIAALFSAAAVALLWSGPSPGWAAPGASPDRQTIPPRPPTDTPAPAPTAEPQPTAPPPANPENDDDRDDNRHDESASAPTEPAGDAEIAPEERVPESVAPAEPPAATPKPAVIPAATAPPPVEPSGVEPPAAAQPSGKLPARTALDAALNEAVSPGDDSPATAEPATSGATPPQVAQSAETGSLTAAAPAAAVSQPVPLLDRIFANGSWACSLCLGGLLLLLGLVMVKRA